MANERVQHNLTFTFKPAGYSKSIVVTCSACAGWTTLILPGRKPGVPTVYKHREQEYVIPEDIQKQWQEHDPKKVKPLVEWI